MAQGLQAPPDTRRSRQSYPMRDDTVGWTAFAVALFFVGASINATYGIVALVKDDHFNAGELLFGDLTAWGVAYLAIACLQALTAVLLIRRNRFGVWLGVLFTLTHALLVFLTIGAYPIWSLTALFIDGLVLYALTVHNRGLEA